MVSIRQNLVSSSLYSKKCPNSMTATRLVIHNTANDASANNEVAYMISNSNQVSFHYAVDDVEIVQGIPENRNAWHAGDGNGTGNRYGLSIEICYSKSGGDKFTKAEQNAAEFAAYLLKQRGWGIDKVTKHQDYSGKYCPHRTLDLGWQRFLNMVSGYLNGTTATDTSGCPYAEPTTNLKKGSSGDGVRWIQWHLTQLEYNIGSTGIDGSFGTNTDSAVKIFQSLSGLTVDGIVGSNTRAALKTEYANKDNTTTKEVIEDMTKEETTALIKELAPSIANEQITAYHANLEGKEVSDYAKGYFAEAKTNGITDGTKPQMYLTRQDAITMFGRMGLLSLKEVDDPSEWAKEIWDELTEEGIFDGTRPQAAISREQVAAVLRRYADKLTAETEQLQN